MHPDLPSHTPSEPESQLRTLCNAEEQKLAALLKKCEQLEEQMKAVNAAIQRTFNDIVAQRAFVSGLRVALGQAPLPNSLPQ